MNIDSLRIYAVLDGERLQALWAEIDRLRTGAMLMTSEHIDKQDPPTMARWLRETAANTRNKRESPHLSQAEVNLAPHVAFRLEQAASMVEALFSQEYHNIDDVAEIRRLRAARPPANVTKDARLAVELREEAESHKGRLYRILRAGADSIERLQDCVVEPTSKPLELGEPVTYASRYESKLPREGWIIDRLPPEPVYIVKHPNGSAIAVAASEITRSTVNRD